MYSGTTFNTQPSPLGPWVRTCPFEEFGEIFEGWYSLLRLFIEDALAAAEVLAKSGMLTRFALSRSRNRKHGDNEARYIYPKSSFENRNMETVRLMWMDKKKLEIGKPVRDNGAGIATGHQDILF